MLTAYASAALVRLVYAQIAAARMSADASTQETYAVAAAIFDGHRTSHKGDNERR